VITRQELNPKGYPLDEEQKRNQEALFAAINVLRKSYGKPMRVTSGVRSQADQARINPGAPKSKHLVGAAVDIADPKGELYAWCKANEPVLIQAGLWCEEGTRGWVHLQCLPPPSGKRWFLP
jgi:hypothetical protein